LAGEDIRPYIGDLTIEKALQNPPPKVAFGTTPGTTTSPRLKIPYTITADKGGIAEVRAFHNGKLVMSDGAYKDAAGRRSPAASASNDSNRLAGLATLRSALPLQARSASASEGYSALPVLKQVTPGSPTDRPVQLDDKATKGNILNQLDAVAKRAKPQDTFVWFVASHGMMDSNGLFGIIAHDTKCLAVDPATQACTQLSGHITSNEILEASKQIKAMKQLMVLDTCHSGGLDNKLSGLYDARMTVLAKNMGLHLYASAQATEAAQDGIPGTNGAFTAQLLAGIKGAAKQDASGNISIVSLGEYAKQKTIEAMQVQSKAGAAAGGSNSKLSTATQTPVIQHFGVDAPVARAGR